MPAKKPRYTPEQHDRLGLELQTMRDRLSEIEVELSHHYPKDVYSLVGRALNAIDAIRVKMDSEVFEEMKHIDNTSEKMGYYYRATRKDHISDPKPVYPLREVKK